MPETQPPGSEAAAAGGVEAAAGPGPPADEGANAGPIATFTLGLFLLVQALTAAFFAVAVFPDTSQSPMEFTPIWTVPALPAWTADRGLMHLAFLAGVLGSSLHTMQSFAAYVGDRKLGRSWIWWYMMRGPIGGLLGLLLYTGLRGGLLDVGDKDPSVNPYGVFVVAALAGWFSKRAADKLAEVFNILFRTSEPAEQTGKLVPHQPET